ncbi:hypothetical protein [Streptomyces sp. NPDC001222]|uniref:hypothetical protein n=1 Tax=Streptomyces sp. NPDC001222 TaxID=3364548 RepID=UPI00368A9715
MITGPEATIVTRASGAVVRGVKEQVTASPSWPSLHAGLMELAAILNDWITAAHEAEQLIRRKLEGEPLPQRRTGLLRAFKLGELHIDGRASNVGRVEELTTQVKEQLTPKVSLVKYLTPEQRRKAARRTLRNVMLVYCPELLDDFEEATNRRREWIEANRSALLEGLDSESADADALRTWAEEAQTTRQGLLGVRSELVRLVRENYPMRQGPQGT